MFSFHKPKVYRSTTGCCICRAKSSSSRFTDSKKYESDFMDCFKLTQQRSGEICNACVLLVKRWKKLPYGTNRNWNHVVDARQGPGTKSLIKSRKGIKSSDMVDKSPKENVKKKHVYIKKTRERSPADLSDDQGLGEERYSEGSSPSVPNSLTPSPYPSPYPSEDDAEPSESSLSTSSRRRKQRTPSQYNYSGFIDFDYWKLEQICCGIIFRGALGEVLIDCRFFKPCCQAKDSSSHTSASPEPPGNAATQSLYATGGSSDGGSNFGDELHEFEDEGMESYDEDHVLDRYYSSSTANLENERLLSHFEATYPT